MNYMLHQLHAALWIMNFMLHQEDTPPSGLTIHQDSLDYPSRFTHYPSGFTSKNIACGEFCFINFACVAFCFIQNLVCKAFDLGAWSSLDYNALDESGFHCRNLGVCLCCCLASPHCYQLLSIPNTYWACPTVEHPEYSRILPHLKVPPALCDRLSPPKDSGRL